MAGARVVRQGWDSRVGTLGFGVTGTAASSRTAAAEWLAGREPASAIVDAPRHPCPARADAAATAAAAARPAAAWETE